MTGALNLINILLCLNYYSVEELFCKVKLTLFAIKNSRVYATLFNNFFHTIKNHTINYKNYDANNKRVRYRYKFSP